MTVRRGVVGESSWAFRVAGATLEGVSDALTIAGIESDGVSEDRGTTTVWFTRRPDVALPIEGVWEEVHSADWSEEWKKGLEPVTVGRITVLPPWLAPNGPSTGFDRDDPGSHIRLVIDPGMAFGTGHHETTTACLRALQAHDLTGAHVVDVGTGTGVLALAASALGADHVTAVDIDALAIRVATENLATHDLNNISLREGSCEVVTEPGQVVIANIITDLLLAIAEDLASLVAPDGVLITSGVSLPRIADAERRFAQVGLDVVVQAGREWAVLLAKNRNAPR